MKLILFPLKKELETFLDIIAKLESKLSKLSREQFLGKTVFFSEDREFLFSTCGLGKVEAALTTSLFLSSTQIEEAYLLGSAGALDENLKLGDVLFATKIIEHDFKSSIQKNLPTFLASKNILDRAKILSEQRDFKVKFAIIASGDEDIVTVERRNQVQSKTGASAVAWEGAGFMRACLRFNCPAVEIRAITDFANLKTHEDFNANISNAMQSLARIMIEILD